MSQRSRQKSRNKGRQSGARGRSGVASTSVATSAAAATSDPASLGSASLAVSGSTALSQAGSAARGGELLPCDEALFDRALTQWQFGDWNRLAGLDPDEFAHHPRRARLALLAAAGHQQLGQLEETRRLVRLAHEWGCDRTLIERVLISGVYNTLGRANALAGRQGRAREQLEAALVVGAPGQDFALLLPARMQQQFDRSGLPRLEQGVGHAAVPALFRCHLELDGQTRRLAFNPASPEHYSVQDGVLSFQLPPGKPGYLVSNETGDFNDAPSVNQLPLEPDTAYELSGHIACSNREEPPVVWLFEYADGEKRKGTSIRTQAGCFQKYIQTQEKSTHFALALRLYGTGCLDIGVIQLRVRSGIEIDKQAASYCFPDETEKLFRQSIFQPKNVNDHPLFLLPVDSRLTDSQGFLIIDAAGAVISGSQTSEALDYVRKGFRGACIKDDKILTCNSFSVKFYTIDRQGSNVSFILDKQVALPEWLIGKKGNADLHHVFYDDVSGELLIANSYMDSVDILSEEGVFIKRRFLWEISSYVDGLVKKRNSNAADLCHLNYIERVGDDILLTLGNLNGTRSGCVISFQTGEIVLDNLGWPHDGMIYEDQYIITETSKNQILYFEGVRQVSDLKKVNPTAISLHVEHFKFEDNLFWPRGVFVNDKYIYVGCSQFQDRDKRTAGIVPSHIAVIDKSKLRVIGRIPVPEFEGLKKPVIYSLLNFK